VHFLFFLLDLIVVFEKGDEEYAEQALFVECALDPGPKVCCPGGEIDNRLRRRDRLLVQSNQESLIALKKLLPADLQVRRYVCNLLARRGF
jgi:hypothetical protein